MSSPKTENIDTIRVESVRERLAVELMISSAGNDGRGDHDQPHHRHHVGYQPCGHHHDHAGAAHHASHAHHHAGLVS